MKLYYTKQELIDIWLARWPQDADCPSLEHNALAGHVETARGFIWFSYYGLGEQ